MQSTLTATETDPHDIFVIEPDVVLAARADQAPAAKTPADVVREILSRPSAAQANTASDIVAAASVPAVDTTFRAAAADTIEAPGIEVPRDIHLSGNSPPRGRWVTRAIIGFVFALGSAAAAEAWDHYGDAAKAMIAEWVPPPFGVVSSQPTEKPGATTQASTPQASASGVQGSSQASQASQASAPDQAAAPAAAPAQPAQDTAKDTATASTAVAATAAAAATSSPPPMARDLAAMGQQIEQLKASIEQLRAGQEQLTQQMAQQMAQQTARNAQPKTAPSPRPKLSALPPQPAAAPRKPRPAFSPAMAAAALAQPHTSMPPQAVYTQTPQPAPTPYDPRAQVIDRADGDPVERPPMPLR